MSCPPEGCEPGGPLCRRGRHRKRTTGRAPRPSGAVGLSRRTLPPPFGDSRVQLSYLPVGLLRELSPVCSVDDLRDVYWSLGQEADVL